MRQGDGEMRASSFLPGKEPRQASIRELGEGVELALQLSTPALYNYSGDIAVNTHRVTEYREVILELQKEFLRKKRRQRSRRLDRIRSIGRRLRSQA